MNSFLRDTLCTNCQSAGLETLAESTATCRYCGRVNTLSGVICAHCEFVNAAGAQTCQECHQTLSRKCANCGTLNWAGAEHCMRCQTPLDAMALLGARYSTDTAARLRAQQRDAPGIKAKEAYDADRRTAELNAVEQRRQQFLKDAIHVRDGQQRIWIAALIVLGFIVIAAAAVAVIYVTSH